MFLLVAALPSKGAKVVILVTLVPRANAPANGGSIVTRSWSALTTRYCWPAASIIISASRPLSGSSWSVLAPAEAKLFTCHCVGNGSSGCRSLSPGGGKIERILIRVDADDDFEPARNQAHICFRFKHDRRTGRIRLHSHRRRRQHAFSRRIRQLEHDGHARRARCFASHAEPIEKAAAHFFARAIEPFGDFRIETRGDLQQRAPEVAFVVGELPRRNPRARALSQLRAKTPRCGVRRAVGRAAPSWASSLAEVERENQIAGLIRLANAILDFDQQLAFRVASSSTVTPSTSMRASQRRSASSTVERIS